MAVCEFFSCLQGQKQPSYETQTHVHLPGCFYLFVFGGLFGGLFVCLFVGVLLLHGTYKLLLNIVNFKPCAFSAVKHAKEYNKAVIPSAE